MRWVITGGTGFVGQALTQYARASGHDVSVFSRTEREKSADGVNFVVWDPMLPGRWQQSVSGADAVVHLAGAGVMDARWTPERRQIIVESRVRSTELLAEAIAGAAEPPRVLISASAVGYYGTKTGDAEITEDAPPGEDFLADVCVQWERAADAARGAGVRVAHPRTGIVLGASGGALEKLLPSFRWGAGATLGTGRQFMCWVHIEDVVRAIAFAVREPSMHGPFNLTAPEPVRASAFSKSLANALGRPAWFKIPSVAMNLGMGRERAEAILTGQRAVPTRLLGAGFSFRYPTLASAFENLLVRS